MTEREIMRRAAMYLAQLVPDLAGRLAAIADDPASTLDDSAVEYLLDRCVQLEDRLFALGAMNEAPCFCCGYNGPGYHQYASHPCAARHRALYKGSVNAKT